MKTVTLLAEATKELTEQINDIHIRIAALPEWAFTATLYLSAATVILAIFIFLRQKKIAQNQVDLAKILQQLIEK